MRRLPRVCPLLALLLVAACSPKQENPPAAPAAASHPVPQAPYAAPVAVAKAPAEQEKCTSEPRTDEHDKRPRCGGMGSTTPAPSKAYRITLENGEAISSCDITQPFSGKVGSGMITLGFTPSDARSGKATWHFAGGGGVADTAYTYTLSGPEEKMTGSFQASTAVCGKAAGLTACAAAKQQTFTSVWTRVEACSP
jgi:hypothetical protein